VPQPRRGRIQIGIAAEMKLDHDDPLEAGAISASRENSRSKGYGCRSVTGSLGPEPPIPADIQREADHERLVGAFPAAAAEGIEPKNAMPGKNRDGEIGSHYR